MKITRLVDNSIIKDSSRAYLDVKMGLKAGRKLAKQKDLSVVSGCKLGLISTYRNLKSSNNILPVVGFALFYFLPIVGSQFVGFAIGSKLKKYVKPTKIARLNRIV